MMIDYPQKNLTHLFTKHVFYLPVEKYLLSDVTISFQQIPRVNIELLFSFCKNYLQ